MTRNISSIVKSLSLSGLIVLFLGVSLAPRVSFAAPDNVAVSTYNSEIANKLVTRCDLIKDYLSKTVRINELAARQNKVRGWEYLLRRLSNLEDSYGKFSTDYSVLAADIVSLRQQLEQFKVDFEAYDGEFQRLLATNCTNNPQGFWKQLETVRSFRAGIALSAENYKTNLSNVISKEEGKW